MRDVQRFLSQVTSWASTEENIVAVALVGSWARQAAKDDSDVDLVIVAKHPDVYLGDDQWVWSFGQPRELTNEDWGRVQSRRVLYTDGLEVEFGVTSLEWADTALVDEGTKRVIADGALILVDKSGVLQRLMSHIAR